MAQLPDESKSAAGQFAQLHFMVVDAFTDRPFSGNPAAVVKLPRWPADSSWLQLIAGEFNLSETAFLVEREKSGEGASSRTGNGSDEFDLRWFTPAVEVDLCGHATLAAAHFLWASGISQAPAVTFHTASGALSARRAGPQRAPHQGEHADIGPIELNFPIVAATPCSELQDQVASALGTSAIKAVLKSKFDILVELPDAESVRKLKPDFALLKSLDARGVIVTALAGSAPIDGRAVDFISRFFAPACGIDEDPVTGSAHCTLAPYWAGKLEQPELLAFQASKRGGHLKVVCETEARRVRLQGTAFVTSSGMLQNAHLAIQETKK